MDPINFCTKITECNSWDWQCCNVHCNFNFEKLFYFYLCELSLSFGLEQVITHDLKLNNSNWVSSEAIMLDRPNHCIRIFLLWFCFSHYFFGDFPLRLWRLHLRISSFAFHVTFHLGYRLYVCIPGFKNQSTVGVKILPHSWLQENLLDMTNCEGK